MSSVCFTTWGFPGRIRFVLRFCQSTSRYNSAAAHCYCYQVHKTILNGKVRFALSSNPQNLADLATVVKQTCKSLKTPESFLAKLKSTKKQRNFAIK